MQADIKLLVLVCGTWLGPTGSRNTPQTFAHDARVPVSFGCLCECVYLCACVCVCVCARVCVTAHWKRSVRAQHVLCVKRALAVCAEVPGTDGECTAGAWMLCVCLCVCVSALAASKSACSRTSPTPPPQPQTRGLGAHGRE